MKIDPLYIKPYYLHTELKIRTQTKSRGTFQRFRFGRFRKRAQLGVPGWHGASVGAMHRRPRASNTGKECGFGGGPPVGLMYASSMPHLSPIYPSCGVIYPPLSSSHATPRPPNEPFFGTSGIETIIQCPDFFSGTPRTDFSVGFEVRSRKSTPTWNSEKSQIVDFPRNRGFCRKIPTRKKGKP